MLARCAAAAAVLAAAARPAAAAAWADEVPDYRDSAVGAPLADNKVELPLSTGAACLDGSPYVFYFTGNASSTRWTITIDGGGWCYNESGCAVRALTRLGTSVGTTSSQGCHCMYYDADGQRENGCNCAHLLYCDGASFSGYRGDPWPVRGSPNNVTQLLFRGLANLDGVLDFLDTKGLREASELVVTGGSAGGLSTFLHADRIAARTPAAAKVRAAPVVGYFLDHDHYQPATHDPFHTYPAEMKYVMEMQNATAGALTPACLVANPGAEWRCIMSPHMAQYIQTPFFMFNSKVDAWQLGADLQVGCLCQLNKSSPAVTCPQARSNCDAGQKAAIAQYGEDFMADLEPVMAMPDNGAFITSCICHGCDWGNLAWDNGDGKKSAYQHYSDWYYGRVEGKKTVDSRGPNGGGALGPVQMEPGWENCQVGFYSS